jgi:hypothetical protein
MKYYRNNWKWIEKSAAVSSAILACLLVAAGVAFARVPPPTPACYENCQNGESCTNPVCSCEANTSQGNDCGQWGPAWHRGSLPNQNAHVSGIGAAFKRTGGTADGCGPAETQGTCVKFGNNCFCPPMNPNAGAWNQQNYNLGGGTSCQPCGA